MQLVQMKMTMMKMMTYSILKMKKLTKLNQGDYLETQSQPIPVDKPTSYCIPIN